MILLQKVSGWSSKSLLLKSLLFGLVSCLKKAALILKRTQILFVVTLDYCLSLLTSFKFRNTVNLANKKGT